MCGRVHTSLKTNTISGAKTAGAVKMKRLVNDKRTILHKYKTPYAKRSKVND